MNKESKQVSLPHLVVSWLVWHCLQKLSNHSPVIKQRVPPPPDHASFIADAESTRPSNSQDSPPQVIPQNLPPSSWITRARHDSRRQYLQIFGLPTRRAETTETNIYFSTFHRSDSF